MREARDLLLDQSSRETASSDWSIDWESQVFAGEGARATPNKKQADPLGRVTGRE
jgi:hypothetical protein